MLVERTFGPDNIKISCNVPDLLLREQLIPALQSTVTEINMPQGFDRTFGQFTMSGFLARYMAGEASLRESRQVSRKRLNLVACEVGYPDPQAVLLHQQIQRYQAAKQQVSAIDTFTMADICAINGMVVSDKNVAGQIRTTQSWIGESLRKARYMCPPPEMVNDLLLNWLDFINDTAYPLAIRAILGQCRLVAIHPFHDGNGRTARLILDVMLEKALGDRVPLFTYRLAPKNGFDGYLTAISLLDAGDLAGLSHGFWQEALDWGQGYCQRAMAVLQQTQSQLFGLIAMRPLSANAMKLLQFLWVQPVVSQKNLLALFGQQLQVVFSTIQELETLGIIVKRQLRTAENAFVYDCPLITEAQLALDRLLFDEAI